MKNTITWIVVFAVVFVAGFSVLYFFQNSNKDTFTGETYTYAESGTAVTAQFSDDGEQVLLAVGDDKYELKRAVSGSGARYTNKDESVVFWEHQGTVRVEINGETVVAEATPVTTDGNEVANDTPSPLSDTTWVWQETLYNNDEMVTPNDIEAFTISFMADGRFSATTDCNNLMGGYKTDDGIGTISLTEIAGTKMACPDIDSQETTFAKMLGEVTGYLTTADGKLALTLKYDSGSMMFTPASTPVADTHPSIVGMTEAEASAYADANDVPFRIIKRDGEFLPATADYRPGRINAEVTDEVVTSYTIES